MDVCFVYERYDFIARTFPQHRELFSNRNLTKLAELPEDTKSKMLAMLKAAIA